jgi:hypothetical protein
MSLRVPSTSETPKLPTGSKRCSRLLLRRRAPGGVMTDWLLTKESQGRTFEASFKDEGDAVTYSMRLVGEKPMWQGQITRELARSVWDCLVQKGYKPLQAAVQSQTAT